MNNLLPFNWLFTGIIGVCLDIIKAPGYIIGAIIFPLLKLVKNSFK